MQYMQQEIWQEAGASAGLACSKQCFSVRQVQRDQQEIDTVDLEEE
jgi:hypothetical protein